MTLRTRSGPDSMPPARSCKVSSWSKGSDGRADEPEVSTSPRTSARYDEKLTGNDAAVVPVRLVVVDPISAYLGGTDSHVNASVREALAPLAALAAKHKVAVIAVSHLNKGGGAAMYRTTGSLAFIAAARAAWVVGRDPDNKERCLMLPVKQNLAPDGGGFAYRIGTVDLDGAVIPRVQWERERIQGNADAILAHDDPGDRTERQEAVEWLREELGAGEVPAREVLRDADGAGISRATLRRAQKDLGVMHSRQGFGRGSLVTWRIDAQRERIGTQPRGVSTYGGGEHLSDNEAAVEDANLLRGPREPREVPL